MKNERSVIMKDKIVDKLKEVWSNATYRSTVIFILIGIVVMIIQFAAK